MKNISKLSKTRIGSSRLLRDKRSIAGVFVLLFAVAGVSLLILTQAASNLASVKSGNWSDPSVWGGVVPAAGDKVTIQTGHSVTFDVTTSPVLADTTVNGTLTFDPAKSAKLITDKNMIVNGKLVMKPSSATIEHFIQFANVDEAAFVGGGMTPVASDVGMWVMGAGQLDIAGTAKRSWTTMSATAAAGATSVTLKDAPTGWRVGDTITFAPNEAPTVGAASYNNFDERVITAISGNTVSFAQGLSRARPFVNNMWGAEVANLTRNVRIEGTYRKVTNSGSEDPDLHMGNSHIFIHATKPQFISNAQLRYMGTMGVNEATSAIHNGGKPGRYALHFHHNGDGSRGSIVDGVVARDSNSHSFVPHASHGITMKNSIAYKGKTGAFWRDSNEEDAGGQTHDITWDHNLVAHQQSRDGSNNAAFFLGEGFNNKVINSSAVGIQDPAEQGGYFWVNENTGVWTFDNNRSHNNNDNGITVWQNSDHVHPIGNFAIYYNQGWGISHGAYANDYHYFNGFVYGNKTGGLELGANSFSLVQQKYENIVWDGAGISPVLVQANHSALEGSAPTLLRDNTFKNYTQHAICVCEVGEASDVPKRVDVVNPTFEGSSPINFGNRSSQSGNRVRVQPKTGQAYQVTTGNVRTNIAQFAATDYGTGTGLLAEYFNSNNLTDKTLTRTIATASEAFAENESAPPYWVTPYPRQFTVRLTGEFQAQFTEAYTFTRDEDVGMRIWVNNQLVLDAWGITDQQRSGTPINLVKGQKYPIRIEVLLVPSGGTERDSAIYNAFLQSPSQYKTVLPMSQLYCGTDPACSVNYVQPADPTTPDPEPEPEPEPPAPTPDTTQPTVTLTAPTNNSTVSNTINMTATASDNVGVSRVDFYVDGTLKGSDTTTPYSMSLDTKTLSNGQHSFTARAFDAAGNNRTTAAATVTISNSPTPPTTFVPEDINQDGRVNLLDFSLLAAKFGQTTNLGRADINGDSKINLLDFSLLAAKFGT